MTTEGSPADFLGQFRDGHGTGPTTCFSWGPPTVLTSPRPDDDRINLGSGPVRPRALVGSVRALPGYRGCMSDERMDEDEVRRTLTEALSLQARSLLEMSLLAGALRGLSAIGTKSLLRQLVQQEIEDTYLLTEKLAALGGTLRVEATHVDVPDDLGRALAQLLDHEREAVAALHRVISHSGQEPRSEALEHLLEHVIMRKQQQVDLLGLAAEQ